MKKLNLLLYLIPLFGLSLMNLIVPHSQEISLLEKRKLMPFPEFSFDSLVQGTYFREYDNYFADHFVFRDTLVQAGSALKEFRGIQGENMASIVVQKGNNMFQDMVSGGGSEKTGESIAKVGTEKSSASASPELNVPAVAAIAPVTTVPSDEKSTPQSKSSELPQSTPQSTEEKGNLEGSESDKYLVLKDRAMSLFSYNASYAKAYAGALNHFQESIDPQVKVYSLLVPSPVEFLNIDKYKSLTASQKGAIGSVNQLLNGKITSVDAYKELAAHAEEYIYFRTDHHWTALGAYYAYKAFAQQTGESPVPLNKYETAQYKGFLGSAYGATLNNNLKKNPDTITIYKPFVPHDYTLFWYDDVPLKRNVVDLNYANKEGGAYQVFLEGDAPWGRITTENHNEKKLLVIKDSYGNPFVPFLLPHYEQIYFLDLRYFKTNVLDFVKEKQITDVLFLDGIAVTSYDGYSELLLSKMSLGKP